MASERERLPDPDFATVNDQIASLVLTPPHRRGWWIGLAIASSALMLFFIAVTWLLAVGVGIWGIDIPVAWGFAITNFVWWIGIGHAGTLISAILLLLHQKWRNTINRFAEAMTIFAVSCAGLFPLLHLGRPWYFYFMVPYPNSMGLWPQFLSPLVWDLFAVLTYLTVSLLFWYMGMVPDFATLRDRARTRGAQIGYGVLSLGWRGAASHWRTFETAYLLLAGLATPLVISVHSIVSLDFAYTLVPGWHSTIFPPYFVAGAIFSGFAMVLTLAIPLRKVYRLENLVTERHLDLMAKWLLATGLMVAYGYLSETFMAFYGAGTYELGHALDRMGGAYGWVFWTVIAFNVLAPQPLWFGRVRRSPLWLFVIALVTNTGMWLERYMIIVGSLHRDYVPAAWGYFYPTFWDFATLIGSIGLFFTLYLLFIRLLPMISIYEVRELVNERRKAP